MAETYNDVLQQIEQLKQKAEKLRQNELASVIAEIKSQIAKYQLTAEDLGLALVSGKKVRAKKGEARYVNPANNAQTWSGKGRRPQWYIDLIASGEDEEVAKIK